MAVLNKWYWFWIGMIAHKLWTYLYEGQIKEALITFIISAICMLIIIWSHNLQNQSSHK